jgi:DNA-binding YbaB/EbfC family protein
MLKQLGQLAGIFQQAQGLPGLMQALQAKLATVRCRGRAADGLVTVELSGQARAVACHVDPSLLHPERQQELQGLIVVAFNDAHGQVRQMAAEEFSQLTGGLNLPGLREMLTGV